MVFVSFPGSLVIAEAVQIPSTVNFMKIYIHKFNVRTASGGSTEITAEIRTHPCEYVILYIHHIYIYIFIYIYIWGTERQIRHLDQNHIASTCAKQKKHGAQRLCIHFCSAVEILRAIAIILASPQFCRRNLQTQKYKKCIPNT